LFTWAARSLLQSLAVVEVVVTIFELFPAEWTKRVPPHNT
jgi:hypothetical protein